VSFSYLDLNEQQSTRVVRPLALISFSPIWLLTGWCELRNAFRNFRLDRISEFTKLNIRYKDEKDKSLATYLKMIKEEENAANKSNGDCDY
jgi:predicted DNA-binding transcriptional regulator YafY